MKKRIQNLNHYYSLSPIGFLTTIKEKAKDNYILKYIFAQLSVVKPGVHLLN